MRLPRWARRAAATGRNPKSSLHPRCRTAQTHCPRVVYVKRPAWCDSLCTVLTYIGQQETLCEANAFICAATKWTVGTGGTSDWWSQLWSELQALSALGLRDIPSYLNPAPCAARRSGGGGLKIPRHVFTASFCCRRSLFLSRVLVQCSSGLALFRLARLSIRLSCLSGELAQTGHHTQ